MRGGLFGWVPNGWQRGILLFGSCMFALGAFSRLDSFGGDSPMVPFLIAITMLFLATVRAPKPEQPKAPEISDEEIKQAADGFQADLNKAVERFADYREALLGTHEGFLMSQADSEGFVTQNHCDGSVAAMADTFAKRRSDIENAMEQQLAEWSNAFDAHKEVRAAIERRVDEFWQDMTLEAARISAKMKARFPMPDAPNPHPPE